MTREEMRRQRREKVAAAAREWQRVEEYVKERNAALASLDMEWARRMMPNASSDAVRLTAMHKARYEATGVDASFRRESREWLEARGLSRFGGLSWPEDDGLPS